MKRGKASVRGKATDRIEIRFEDQLLTAHAGLVLYQSLFARLGPKERLRGCFSHLPGSPVYAPHVIALLLVVHLGVGFRELRETRYYRDDEMVRRTPGLRHLPEVSTVSRMPAGADGRSVDNVRGLNRRLVLDRAAALGLARVTLDFGGSVPSTKRAAEGTAVGFNKRKKGLRSYYPLFATVAQTGQVFDLHHRPGNGHDSSGAEGLHATLRGASPRRAAGHPVGVPHGPRVLQRRHPQPARRAGRRVHRDGAVRAVHGTEVARRGPPPLAPRRQEHGLLRTRLEAEELGPPAASGRRPNANPAAAQGSGPARPR